jgi:signal transduction histidine kinase
LVRFDYAALQKSNMTPRLAIQSIKLDETYVSWHSLNTSADLRPAIVGNSTQAYLNEDVVAIGRALTTAERKRLQQRFSDIRFNSVSRFYPIPQNLVLPYKHNNITIDFVAIETGKPQMVNYQYMLEGYDKDWSPVVKKTSATFGNMYEGDYIFKVKAQGPGGAWSEPVTYAFSVLPPWYRSWWAYGIYLLVIAFVVYKVHQFQRVKTIRIMAEKARAQELIQAKEIEKAYTELKATQAQLIQSEKMASLGELTAGIAHEIQNPLNFVNNFSEVSNELLDEMNNELDKGDVEEAKAIAVSIKQNLQKITHHGKRADSIVKGMLQHSRQNNGLKELTDINALADEYLRLSYHGLRAKDKSFNAIIETHLDPGVGKLEIASQDIGRVLLNLFTNAFYSVQAKKIAQGASYEPTVTLSTRREGNAIIIQVKDNGMGIPQAVLGKIYQPFFTTKPAGQGTGLGLSMSYDIITKGHGGSLEVRTKEGEYAEFEILLPV